MSNKIRVGMIGIGGMSYHHISPQRRRLKFATISALSSGSPDDIPLSDCAKARKVGRFPTDRLAS